MYQLITALLLCLATTTVGAQNKADIEVSYLYTHPAQTMRSAQADVTNHYILLSNGWQSKFYSPKTEYIDSIESTPEGWEWFNTFKRACYEKKQSDMIPRVDGSFYISKSISDRKICSYDVANGIRFKWDEPLPVIDWEIADSTKTLLGYECFMASVNVHGRKWTAWFAPEVPVSDGPWKLHGLPGLILEAECDGGQYHFLADGLQYATNPYYKVYSEPNWETISGKDFWQLRRQCLDNPRRGRGLNTIVYQGIEYSDHLPRDVVDYIETDY